MNAIKKAARRKTTKTYFFRSILYYIAEFIKENKRDILGVLLMLLIWGMGAVTGAIWCFLRLAS